MIFFPFIPLFPGGGEMAQHGKAEERTGSVSTRPDSTVLDPFSQVKSEANNNGVNGKWEGMAKVGLTTTY